MATHIITIRPRFWWPNLIFVILASGLSISLAVQAIISRDVEFHAGMLIWVGLILWRGYGLNHFIRITKHGLIIKHSSKPLMIDWAHIARIGTLQGLMGNNMPYLILHQSYANLPELELRRVASPNFRDQILIINPLSWSNTDKLWPLILQHLPAINEYQVPFDFSATSRVERRNLLIFGLVVLGILFGACLILWLLQP